MENKTFKDYFIEMLLDATTNKVSLTKVLALVFSTVQIFVLIAFVHIVYRLLLGDNDPTTTGDTDTLKQLITGGVYNGIFILLLAAVIKIADVSNLKNTLQNQVKDGNNP